MSSLMNLFKAGVNIIHGSNGSGKSTVTDFIFFGLGGDLSKWKPVAARAEKVHLQITTPSGTLTLCREVSEKTGRPMSVYFWPYEGCFDITAGCLANASLPASRAWH